MWSDCVPPEHGRERFQRGADHVHLRFEGGEGRSRGLGVEPQHLGPGALGAEPVPQQLRPEAAGGAELGHFLEEIPMRVEEEGDPGGHLVHRQAARDRPLDVGEAVGQGESHLLGGGATRLAHVVAADAHRLEARQLAPAPLDEVGGEPHGRLGRIDPGSARCIFLQDVVLDRSGDLLRRDPLTPRRRHVESHQDRRRGVDRHGRGNAVEGDPAEQRFHVLQRIDGDPDPAHLAGGQRVVGVVADLGGKVEGDGKTRLSALQQAPVAAVGLGGGGVAGVLPHGPEPLPIAGGPDAAGERRFARRTGPGPGVRRVRRQVDGPQVAA